MQIEQRRWSSGAGWVQLRSSIPCSTEAQLVLVFGSRQALGSGEPLRDIRARYPTATLLGCSTSGEIAEERVLDDTVVATAVAFDDVRVVYAHTALGGENDSREAGRRVAGQLDQEGLRHVLVVSDGLKVNGSQLVDGLTSSLPSSVAVTGGLAGDGTAFGETLVVHGDTAVTNHVTAAGLYGAKLQVGYGSLGGFDPFGPERLITRANGNVLYELDGQSALALYKRYLGEHAHELPASALLFPLCIRPSEGAEPLVRTILGVDEAQQSMTFAGDMPVGSYARLMKANFDRLIDGAETAAHASVTSNGDEGAELALLVSCVGRRLVLKQRTEEEVEAVRQVVGPDAAMTGFYSYGEISPFTPEAKCQLHNQSMTITTFREA